MIPQVQSKTGKDGRCLNACIASILEIKEHEVPDFTDENFISEVNTFLAPHGLYYVQAPLIIKPVGYSTIEGVSPRGGLHACVALNGKLVWDPHPQDGTGRGLKQPECYGILGKRFT